MTRLRPAHCLLTCTLLGSIAWLASTPAAAAEPSNELEKMRREFIDSFSRTALNTTPGDATFLRIMVAVSGAKRGVEIGAATGKRAYDKRQAIQKRQQQRDVQRELRRR